MNRMDDERGAALIAAVLVTVILSMLSTVSLNLGAQEMEQMVSSAEYVMAQHAAEAGLELVTGWFHDPGARPPAISATLVKRFDLPDGGVSYFDVHGRSQFTGTADRPDIVYDASQPEDNRLMNDPRTGWFRSLSGLGRLLKLRLYGPQRPGLLCTVEVTAEAHKLKRTLSVQLGAIAIPSLRSGVQIGSMAQGTDAQGVFPVSLHWGDLIIERDAYLGKREDLPSKTALAPITGQWYAQAGTREDRWLDFFIGGIASFAPSADQPSDSPANVYPQRNPMPGLRVDRWRYETLKMYALRYGSYYARGTDGLLYLNGRVEPDLGRTLEEITRSRDIGDHHGLVFVDTLDQQPPRPDNLGTLRLETDYAEGLFVINANVEWKITGPGRAMSALSPSPEEDVSALGTRVPVQLSGIHLRGVLSLPGTVAVEETARLYGALLVGETVVARKHTDHVEVWYDHDLKAGLFRGLPIVYPAPGTWEELL